jgi:predicted O-linked N-acetylglucosamine transferase (SPINDLY family)
LVQGTTVPVERNDGPLPSQRVSVDTNSPRKYLSQRVATLVSVMDDRDRAKDLFFKGVACLERRDFCSAERIFVETLKLAPRSVPTFNNLAIAQYEQGKTNDAALTVQKVLEIDPDNIDAYLTLSTCQKDQQRYDEVLKSCQKVISIDPKIVEAHCNLGYALSKTKNYEEAIASFDRAIELNPRFVDAFLNRGNTLNNLKRYDEALAAFEKALSLRPDLAEAWLGRGNTYFELKRYDEALVVYEKALALKPDLIWAWIGRGNTYAEFQSHDKALAAYERALAVNPNFGEAWVGYGNTYFELDRYDEALAAYDKALALKPDLADVWLGRGNVSVEFKRYDDAFAAYDKALALKSDLAEAWLGRGNVFFELNRYDEAFAAFDKALALKPDLAEAWLGRGKVLTELQRYDGALADCGKALELKPDLAKAWLAQGIVLFLLGRNDEALASYSRSIDLKPDLVEALSNKIFALDFSPDASLSEQQEARHDWWRRSGEPVARSASQPHDNSRDPDRRLVIGYVSSDFRQHSAASAFGPILRNHDKKRFEITCYTCNHYEDHVTNSFRSIADTWREVSQLSDEELAQQIRSDHIDILVDLSGHSRGNRLKTFARKPAPVQVTAWGHATGTGIPTIDYLFSDPVAIPKSVRHLFAERIIDLPCAIITELLPQSVLRNDPPALQNGYCTFGFFNRAQKISDEAIKTWADILTKIPDAKLLMKDVGFDAEPIVASLRKKFSLHGISSDRIRFLGYTPRLEHLAAFNQVDICLDPFPQNGGVSTWEALQMGVPVVAKLGATVPSRISGAILTSIGMSDWVAEGTDSYVSIAVKNAGQVEHLAKLRRELTGGTIISSVLDGAAYTRVVEEAYRRMWHTYCLAG